LQREILTFTLREIIQLITPINDFSDKMQDPTMSFIMKQFKKYYNSQDIELPERLSRREFGFMFFDRGFVLRHIGFRNRQELKSYIVENIPSHIYYSSAYYDNPAAQTMAEKGWMGADMVFDLDADHVKGASELSYPEMLQLVKREVIRLLDEFILGDLGFDIKRLKIVFSGGRGYHVHIRDPRVFKLGSHERREIVDYITGTNLDFEWIFPTKPFDAVRFGQKMWTKFRREMPDKMAGGWRRRMAAGIGRFIVDLEVMGEDEAIRRYSSIKDSSGRAIGEKTMRGMYRELFERRGGKKGVDRMREESNLEIFSKQNYLSALIRLLEEHAKISLVGETDEPVTSDVKRLIRLPLSLHGKTGLVVTTLAKEELDHFDPLRDAIPVTIGGGDIRMEVNEPVDIELRGERIKLSRGETEVPEFAALFLACRKIARVI